MARIAIGGFHHETNTFATTNATYGDFVAADAWPGLCSGDDIFAQTKGINLAVSGFADKAAQMTQDLLPKIGRARPHAGKSIGSPDPGAVSMALIINAVNPVLRKHCS